MNLKSLDFFLKKGLLLEYLSRLINKSLFPQQTRRQGLSQILFSRREREETEPSSPSNYSSNAASSLSFFFITRSPSSPAVHATVVIHKSKNRKLSAVTWSRHISVNC